VIPCYGDGGEGEVFVSHSYVYGLVLFVGLKFSCLDDSIGRTVGAASFFSLKKDEGDPRTDSFVGRSGYPSLLDREDVILIFDKLGECVKLILPHNPNAI